MTQSEFLTQAYAAAKSSGCLFPDAAACEAAWASHDGSTQAAIKGNNLFDFRVPAKLYAGAMTVPIPNAKGYNSRLAFKSWEDCFHYRAEWMARMTMFSYVRKAKTVDEYLAQMQRLSSDFQYAAKVKAIYTANEELFK